MHDRLRFRLEQGAADFVAPRQVAAYKSGAIIHGAAVALRQVVENDDFVTFIQQQLDADASDVTRPTDDKDFHPRKVRRALPLSKESPPRKGGGFARSAFSKGQRSSGGCGGFLYAGRGFRGFSLPSPTRG